MGKEGYFSKTSFCTQRAPSAQTDQVGETNRMRRGVPLASLKRELSWLMCVSFLAPERGSRVWQQVRLESRRARLICKVGDLGLMQTSHVLRKVISNCLFAAGRSRPKWWRFIFKSLTSSEQPQTKGSGL